MDDDSAQYGSDHRGDSPDTRKVPLHLAAFSRRIQVGHDSHGDRLHGTRAGALNKPTANHDRHGPCETCQQRSQEKNPDSHKHDRLAAVHVRKISEHYCRGGLRQQKRGKHPTVETQSTKVCDDLRHRSGHYGRFDGDHGHRRHYRGNDERTGGFQVRQWSVLEAEDFAELLRSRHSGSLPLKRWLGEWSILRSPTAHASPQSVPVRFVAYNQWHREQCAPDRA